MKNHRFLETVGRDEPSLKTAAKEANQRTPKALFTCVGYTKKCYGLDARERLAEGPGVWVRLILAKKK